MGFEYELKFSASAAQQAAIAGAMSQPGQVIAMETTYYDTPEGLLSARRITLRRRFENGVSICTVKTPAVSGRGEWETRCDAIEAAVPILCKLGAPEALLSLTAGGLVEVCGARFQRTAYTLSLPDAVVEVALDAGVLTGGGRECPLCEVEVELKSGSRDGADRYARDLARTYGLEPLHQSKFRRALGLAKGEGYGTAYKTL